MIVQDQRHLLLTYIHKYKKNNLSGNGLGYGSDKVGEREISFEHTAMKTRFPSELIFAYVEFYQTVQLGCTIFLPMYNSTVSFHGPASVL